MQVGEPTLKIKKISDDKYHSVGGFNLQDPPSSLISASLLKDAYDRGLYESILQKREIDEDTRELFRLGTLIHLYILEPDEFDKKYYIGAYDPLETREQVESEIGDLLEGFKKEIELKYPNISDGEGAELAIIGEYDGVFVKSKLDKMVMIDNGYIVITDVKSTRLPMAKVKRDKQGRLWEIAREIDEYHIDLQMAFYAKLAVEAYRQRTGTTYEVICELLFCSKADGKTRLIRLSPEKMEAGNEKLGRIWNDVKEFTQFGIGRVEKALLV